MTTAPTRDVTRLYGALLLLALAVYGTGSWWGVPHATAPNRTHAWGVDDETPLGSLAEMHNIVQPKPAQNLGYPLMYPFLSSASFAPYLAFLKVTGKFSSPSSEYPYGFADPASAIATLGLIAHLLTVLLGAGVVLCVYDATRVAAGKRSAMLAALMAMLAYPMVYYSRTGNVDVPMLFFTSAAFAAYARCVMLGLTPRRLIALGAMAGFALATKEAALGAFLLMPVALLMLQSRATREAGGLRRGAAWKPLLAGLGAAVFALGAGSGLFVDPQRYFAHLRFLTGRLETLAAGATPTHVTYPYTLAGHWEFAGRLLGDVAIILTWPGLVLALAGVAWLALRRSRLALLALPAFTYALWMFWTLRVAQLRYMLPTGILLAPFAALLLQELLSSRFRAARVLATLAAVFVLGMLALRSIDLTWQMIGDSRYEAKRWLAERTSPGDRIEYFGADQKLPPIPAGVVTATAAPYRGMYVEDDVSEQAAERILAGWAERKPKFILAIPDHTSAPGVPYSRSFPPQLFESMVRGESAYRLVATFQTPRPFPWLELPPLDYPAVNPPIRIFAPGD